MQTVKSLISSTEEISNSTKIEKRILFYNCSQKSFITKQLKEQLSLKVLKTEQMFIKTFASSKPTLQNLEVVEVEIGDVENLSYKIINTLVVPLVCNPLSDQCVSISENQYDHLKYLKLSDSSDSKLNCNVDILIGADYYWHFLSGNIRRGNSGPVAAETILGWVLSRTYEFENNISATVNLSSTHVLKTSVQEININYDTCFQKVCQIEITETKVKSFSDYSKDVYFNGHI